MDDITVIQHNVLNWKERRHGLTQIYNKYNPDVILLNSHCVKETEPLKTFGYSFYYYFFKTGNRTRA